ncbi:FACT complex subunit SPT16-like [Papaver somniferum]|uniref:FACT complex subunit SPT16-like n=1 Tax=Papaver somniferum TaxID=3469 RepID=UPI000E6F93A0|nr:FACT complex subunit SPT16-like [Papaver somniferum]
MVANGNASGKGVSYTIDLENFSKHLKAFYSHWKENKINFWGGSDAIVIATPPASEDLRYLKSSALNLWLYGLEFPETIMVFMDKQIHFLCGQKKAALLNEAKKSTKDTVGAETVMHIKEKNDAGTALMDDIFQAISKSSGNGSPIVAYIAKEAPEGNLLELWSDKLKTSSLQLADVTTGFSELFAVKNNTEITNIKKAAFLSSSVMKHFVVPKLEKIIDEEKKVTHSSLMEDTEKAVQEPAKVKVKLKADNVDICYPPIFQSGGEFDLRPSASSNEENLYYDSASVIICAVGSRYNS